MATETKNNTIFGKIIWGSIMLSTVLMICCIWYNTKLNHNRNQYHQNYEKLKQEVEIINNKIANTTNINTISFQNSVELYNYFADRARSSKVNIQKFSLANKVDFVQKLVPLEIELLGDYPDFIDFFKVINYQSYAYLIEKVVFAESFDDTSYTTKVYLKINVPVMRGGNQL